MKRDGIDTLVSLLEDDKAAMLDLGDEGLLAEQIGMQFLSYPIPDVHVPPNTAIFKTFVVELANRLRAGQRIGLHCRGSIGRATVTASCTLIQLGWTPRSALAAVSTARGCMVPDTQEQEDWILRYEPRR
jgi:protein-tyrosine phosphatase